MRSQEAPSDMGLAEVLGLMVERAEEGDWEGFSGLMDAQYPDLLEVYHQRRRALHATSVSEGPAGELFHQFQDSGLDPYPSWFNKIEPTWMQSMRARSPRSFDSGRRGVDGSSILLTIWRRRQGSWVTPM